MKPETGIFYELERLARGAALSPFHFHRIFRGMVGETPLERSDAAVVISENAKVPEGLVEQRIVGGRYTCRTHVGPYEELGDAWARFMGHWLPGSGERIGSGVSFELYRNNPMEVPKTELITELYISLE